MMLSCVVPINVLRCRSFVTPANAEAGLLGASHAVHAACSQLLALKASLLELVAPATYPEVQLVVVVAATWGESLTCVYGMV